MYAWEITFSNLNLNITSTYGALDFFIVAKAEAASIDESPLNAFMPMIPTNGIDITTTNSGASITDFPSDHNWMFMPVSLSASGGGNMMYGSPIVISEMQTLGNGGATDEFIELYNTTPDSYDLSTWSIQYRGSYATTTINKINLTGNIPGNGFYLITNSDGYNGGVATDKAQTGISLNATGGTIVLVNNQTTLTTDNIATASTTADKLSWGTGSYLHPEGTTAPAPPSEGSLERKAFPNSNPSTMIGGVDSTKGNQEDINDNSSDFIMRLTSLNISTKLSMNCCG